MLEAMARNPCRSESTDGLQPCINKWEAHRNLWADSKFNRVWLQKGWQEFSHWPERYHFRS